MFKRIIKTGYIFDNLLRKILDTVGFYNLCIYKYIFKSVYDIIKLINMRNKK